MLEKHTRNLVYHTPHLPQLKLKKNQPPTFDSEASGSEGDTEISVWHAVPLQVGQSLAQHHARGQTQNGLYTLVHTGVFLGEVRA